MNILLPFDGSPCALRATEQLLSLGSCWREVPDVHLLHVHAPIPIGRVQAHIGKEQLHAYYREESEALLVPAQTMLDSAGCRYATHIHVGQPAETIARLAGELKVELIIMGTQGHASLVNLLMGSVATQVLHLVTCPVLFVK